MKCKIATAAMVALAFASCSREKYPAPDRDKYIYPIPQVNITEDVLVGALYTPVSPTYWDDINGKKSYTGTPEQGRYSSLDAVTMARHIDWADEAGIDYFVFAWNAGATDDSQIQAFLAGRAGADVKMVIEYSTSHLGPTNAEPLQSQAKLTQMLSEFSNRLMPYLQDEAYLTVDGRPVIMIGSLNLPSAALSSADYSLALPGLRAELDAQGMDPYLIGSFGNGWTAPANYPKTNIEPFDAVTVKDWSTNDYDRHYGFFSFIDLNWANWRNTIEPWGTDFVPCIFPSFDNDANTVANSASNAHSLYYFFGRDGSTDDFVNFCNVAKRNMGDKRLVLIDSWNDWRKGTNMEPGAENGGNFLTVCRAQFKVD